MSVGQFPGPRLTRRQLMQAGALALGTGVVHAPTFLRVRERLQSNLTRGFNSLGTPVVDVANAAGDVGLDPAGHPRIYTVSSGSGGNPGQFNVVDVDSNEVLHSEKLHGPSSFGVLAATPNLTYVSDTAGHLYRWTSDQALWEDLGTPLETEGIIYRLAADEEGRVYGGTYPNGKVFQYDPETDSSRDYGQLLADQSYIRSVSYHAGTIYAGTQPQARLVTLDVGTGETAEIDFPAGTDLDQLVHDMHLFDDLLYARLTKAGGAGSIYVYDLTTEDWVDIIEDVNGRDISPPDETGAIYFLRGDRVVRYDPLTHMITDTEAELSTGGRQLRGMGWATLSDPSYPGATLVSMVTRGEGLIFNPESGASDIFQTEIPGTPVSLRALAVDDQGRVHAGASNPGGHAVVDPQSGSSTQYTLGAHQGMLADGSDLYLGTYGSARIYKYDTLEPWNTPQDPDPEAPATNPVELFNGADAEQDRPFSLALVGAELAIGTVSRTGTTGGALTLYDLNEDSRTVFREEFIDHSVVALAATNSTLFCGTSIHGGYGSTAREAEAKIFAFDLTTRTLQWETVPVPGEPSISALTTDASGQLWGITAGKVFTGDAGSTAPSFDVVEYESYSWPSPAWVQADIQFNPADGFIYATVPNHGLLQIDPSDGEATVVQEHSSLYRMAIAADGTLFVSAGAELYSIPPDNGHIPTPELLDELQLRTTDYIDDGEIQGPITHHLSTALDQAVQHSGSGRARPTIVALRRYVRHLDNPKPSDTVAAEAQEDLLARANFILQRSS